jgi:hypothetical protein
LGKVGVVIPRTSAKLRPNYIGSIEREAEIEGEKRPEKVRIFV